MRALAAVFVTVSLASQLPTSNFQFPRKAAWELAVASWEVTRLLATPEALLDARQDAAAIVGMWRGTATVGTQSAEVAVDIRRVKDGVALFMTLPRLHAWRMPVGYLKQSAMVRGRSRTGTSP